MLFMYICSRFVLCMFLGYKWIFLLNVFISKYSKSFFNHFPFFFWDNISFIRKCNIYNDISIDCNDFDAGLRITFRNNLIAHCKKQWYLDKKNDNKTIPIIKHKNSKYYIQYINHQNLRKSPLLFKILLYNLPENDETFSTRALWQQWFYHLQYNWCFDMFQRKNKPAF